MEGATHFLTIWGKPNNDYIFNYKNVLPINYRELVFIEFAYKYKFRIKFIWNIKPKSIINPTP